MSEILTNARFFFELSAQVLREGSTLRFRAHGQSMRPFLHDGDVLTIVPVPPARIRLGDVVFYPGEGGHPNAHRVRAVERRPGTLPVLLIRGDARDDTTERVPQGAAVGRVTHRQRAGRNARVDGWTARWSALLWLAARPRLRALRARIRALRARLRARCVRITTRVPGFRVSGFRSASGAKPPDGTGMRQ